MGALIPTIMATYLPADVKTLEYTEDDPGGVDPTYVDVNFIDPSAYTITETPVRQGVNSRKQVTAMKDVEIDCLLFDHALLTSIRTLEQANTPVAWKLTLMDDSTITTKRAPISIGRELSQSDGLQGFQVLSNYGTTGTVDPVT